MTAADFLGAAQIYGWIGLGVAAAFLVFGAGRVDASMRGSYATRALLAPSVILLWPIVAFRWAQLEARGASGGDADGAQDEDHSMNSDAMRSGAMRSGAE
ncbi:MAG: hypothetical protein AAGM38_12845 [Pseudomonadota bacterium]